MATIYFKEKEEEEEDYNEKEDEYSESMLPEISVYHDISLNSSRTEEENEIMKIEGRLNRKPYKTAISSDITTNIMSHQYNNLIQSIMTIKCYPATIKKMSPNLSFGMIQCSRITTYFFGTESYSQLTSTSILSLFDHDPNSNVFFITKPKTYKPFPLFKLLPSLLYKTNIPKETMNKFISRVNDSFYKEYEYKAIMSLFRNRIIVQWLSVLVCLSSLFGVIYYLYQSVIYIKNVKQLDYWVVLFLFASIIIFLIYSLWILYWKIKDIDFELLTDVMKYRHRKYCYLKKFIEENNRLVFFNYSIVVTIPLSVDYIMINCSPSIEIELHSHLLSELKCI